MTTPVRTVPRGRHAVAFAVLLAAVVAVGASRAVAQGGGGTESPTTPAAPAPAVPEIELADYDPATVTVDELRLRLRPMRKDAVAEQLDRLVGLVEAKSKAIAATDLAARQTTDAAAQAELVKRSNALKEERKVLVERAVAAADLLEERGGDPAEQRQYLAAVSTTLMADLSGIASGDSNAITVAWQSTLAWLKSPEGGLKILRNVVLALVVMVVFWFLARILGRLSRRAVERFPGASALLRDFLVGLVRKLVLLVGAIVAISMLGVNIGPLAAAIGAAGLVIGLALQGTLSNFASGILILLYRPFDVGDFVTAGGVSGKVESMTMVNTTVATPDNQKVIVPNNAIWNNVITNVTGKPTRRVDLTFGIGYADDVDKATKVLERIVADHPQVLKDPAPVIKVHQLADSSVNFVVRPWAKTEDYWAVYWDVTRAVKQRFDAEEITIPFPQRDVHVYQESRAYARED